MNFLLQELASLGGGFGRRGLERRLYTPEGRVLTLVLPIPSDKRFTKPSCRENRVKKNARALTGCIEVS